VYLPAGTWIDYWSGDRVEGGRSVARPRPADELPLYVRAGSAFADNFRSPSLWASPWRPDDLARAGRQGWIVAAERRETVTARSGATTLRATVSARGDVRITLRAAEPSQQLRVHVPRRICSVDGLTHARTLAGLRSSSGGWLRDPARRATVVLKAHVARSATLVLRAC
jgi:alpha-D-xyloside xylohydrolase